jgi:hypothetical protein
MPDPFEAQHKKLMARFKQQPDPDTAKMLKKMDEFAKRLGDKTISAKVRSELVTKLKEKMKKLILVIKDDIKEREKEHKAALRKPPEGFNPQGATQTFNNIKRELGIIQRKAQEFTDRGGEPPPPPKLPELFFGLDYKKLLEEYDGEPDPAVVNALDRLDENADAKRVLALVDAARGALEKQIAALAAEKSKCREQQKLISLTKLVTELTDFRKQLKEFATRVFLIHRLK